MMRVLQIANYKPGTGGISGQVEKIHTCLDADGIYNAIFSVKGSVWYRVKAFFRLLTIGREYDVFHIHTCSGYGFISAVIGIIVGKLLKKRLVLTYHGGGGEKFFARHTRLVRHYLLKTDVNIVLSGFIGSAFERFGIPCQEIPNIIELDAARFKKREEIRPSFISIRTLSPLYNIECIIKAFAVVKSKLPTATLTIVSDGPSRMSLENMVSDLCLKDVTFVGRVDNSKIYGLLDEADIMVSSPLIDNMPVSVLEGMNAGLLVISSNVGGVPFMIENGVNGLLFPSNDIDALAERMVEAVANQEVSKRMIEVANQTLEKYSWKSVKCKIFKAYGI